MIELTFDQDLQLLENHASGTIYIDHYQHILSSNQYPRYLKVLIDTRDGVFKVKPGELSQSIEILKQAILKYTYIKEAIITEKPYETAIATLFHENAKMQNYQFKIFFSRDSALQWLTK